MVTLSRGAGLLGLGGLVGNKLGARAAKRAGIVVASRSNGRRIRSNSAGLNGLFVGETPAGKPRATVGPRFNS